MKKKLLLIMCVGFFTFGLTGCGSENTTESGLHVEAIPETDAVTADEGAGTDQEENKTEITADNAISQEQALAAIQKYCLANDPELEKMINSGDYGAYFDVSTADSGEIVVLYRSYTAAQIRYYIDPTSGDVYVTERVPGIIDDEQRTNESFNMNDYMSN